MKMKIQTSLRRSIVVILLIAVATACLTAYYSFNPDTHSLFPQCAFHRLTGLQCPSCGNQRALHALLHGDIQTAAHHNIFFFIALPYVTALLVTSLTNCNAVQRYRKRLLSGTVIKTYILLYLLWGIIRNILP